ncbi:flavoprotein-like protein [Thamnidium elegans]|nr:flavoprotein-like protein [Thamnidium elegans]
MNLWKSFRLPVASLKDCWMGVDVRVDDPTGLPLNGDVNDTHEKVVELRQLSEWSESLVWCSPEQHGQITGVFKTQIDWITLSVGSVRPTQGRTLAVACINGGSQRFNVVNMLRVLGRLMHIRYRDRVIDVAEELSKITATMRPPADHLIDRYSERKEKATNDGRLLSQEEKEEETKKD